MRKMLAAAIAAAVCLGAITAFGLETPSAIFVNGRRVNAEAFISGDTTYVPLRAVSEMLGAKVEWNEDTSEISISSEGGAEPYEYAVSQISPSTVAIVGSYAGETTETYQDRYAEGIAHGTGVIVSSSGEIITNAHVVKDMTAMIVILSSGEGYPGAVKYFDDELDLAVVKIEKSGLTAARFADESEIKPGCRVVAVGTPVSMSLRNSVSAGIISGVNRGVNSSCKLIQTDAAVNPGNSGGPLVNLRGEVVGICSSGYTGIGIEGLNFAIPVSDVNYALEHFRTYGRINRPSFGAELEESLAAKYGLPGGGGLTFRDVSLGGAAVYADAAAEAPGIEDIIDSIIPETDLLPTVTPRPEKTETKITISFRIGDSTLKINGKDVTVTTPFEENGTTLVPLRVITEAFGAAVDWSDTEQSVTLACDDNIIKLRIDSTDVQINGEKAILPMAPRLVNDTTMVPLRFISEYFGADVSYDEKTESVLVEKTVIEDLAVDDYSSILHNSDKEFVGDSYYGWKMKSLKELSVASRSFDGRTTVFTGQGESALIISVESIGDMDKDMIFSAAKKAADGITVSRQDESKDINGNDCLTIEGKTSNSKMLIKAAIDGETLFTLYAAGETDNGADEVLTAARTFTAGAHNFSDALDLSDVKDNKRVYENKKLNFSIELPADWREVSDRNIENRVEFTNASVSDESYSRISVGVQSKNNMKSAEKWAQRDFERNKSAFNPDCAEFSDGLIDDSFAGNPAKYYTYKLTYTYDNSAAEMKDVFFEKGEYVYNFSFYSRGDDGAGLSMAESSVTAGGIDYSEVGDLLLVDEEGSKKYNGLNGVSFTAPDYWTAVYSDGYTMVSNGAMTVSAAVIDETLAKYASENLYDAYGSQLKSFKKLNAPMYMGIGGKTGYYFAFTYKDSRSRLYAREVFAYDDGDSCVVFENDVMFENMGEMSKKTFETAIASAETN